MMSTDWNSLRKSIDEALAEIGFNGGLARAGDQSRGADIRSFNDSIDCGWRIHGATRRAPRRRGSSMRIWPSIAGMPRIKVCVYSTLHLQGW